MEVMSYLLLCAVLAALPQTLGLFNAIKFNKTIPMNAPVNMHKKLLLNVKATPLVTTSNEFKDVFDDRTCASCSSCMDRAIQAYKNRYYKLAMKPNLMEMYNDVLKQYPRKFKRSLDEIPPSNITIINNNTKNAVTKYFDENGNVYALKIKETSNYQKYDCNIFIVKQTIGCNAMRPMMVTMPSFSKKGKRSKKVKKTKPSTVRPMEFKTTLIFQKRDAENVPDGFMPSIEDMY